MKGTSFHFGEMAVSGAWARLAFAEIFSRFQVAARSQPFGVESPGGSAAPIRVSLFERLDRWMYRQRQREREAWLSGAQNVFELEERMRYLERSIGGRYY